MFSTIKGRVVAFAGTALAVGVIASSITLAQAQEGAASNESEALRVGTYEMQRAIQEFHETKKLQEEMQELQSDFMAAQQAGDQQRLMEIQIHAQRREAELFEAFESRIQQVMPEIARQHDLQVIALELMYYDPEIEPQDVTDAVIQELNADAETEDAADEQQQDPAPEPTPEGEE